MQLNTILQVTNYRIEFYDLIRPEVFMASGSVLDKSVSFQNFKPNKTEYIKMMSIDEFVNNLNKVEVDVMIQEKKEPVAHRVFINCSYNSYIQQSILLSWIKKRFTSNYCYTLMKDRIDCDKQIFSFM